MTKRKGEMTSAAIDRDWPHQVALRSEVTVREFHVIEAFCKDLSRCPRGHSVCTAEGWWNVYCFARRDDAAKFMARFGGETLNPADPARAGALRRRRPPSPPSPRS
jgi:hypothetical protein